MDKQLITRQEMRRLPFQRRPIAEPGTALVFQMADGRLVAPIHPYTSGEVWWRGPKAVYVVDASPHKESFPSQLPCSGDAMYFTATVSYSWRVRDAAQLVKEQVSDAAQECENFLVHRMRVITRRYPPLKSDRAEQGVHAELGRSPIDLRCGLRVTDISVQLSMDADQAVLAKELEIINLRQALAEREEAGRTQIAKMSQSRELEMQRERVTHFAEILADGGHSVVANILAQDPDKAGEVATLMFSLSERDQRLALEAMKVLVDGDQLRIGELDDAVRDTVERFRAMIGKNGGAFGMPALEAPGTAAREITGTAADSSHGSVERDTSSGNTDGQADGGDSPDEDRPS